MRLDITSTVMGGCHVLAPAGEIDVATAEDLREALQEGLEAGHTRVVVDLSAVPFLDSTGLGVLVGSHQAFVDAGASLSVAGATDQVRKVFDLTGLTDVLGLVATVDEACADRSHA